MTAYTTGTITLTNGSTAVTGDGTGWATALIAGGVIYPQAAGNPLPIASVDSNTEITAATEWTGATGTYAYALQRQDDANQVIANAVALADYIQRLDNETLSALAGLTPAADRLAYFSGAGTAELTTLTSFARSLIDDANASTALTTLGVSAFAKTLLDDADASAALTTLGVSAFAKTLLDDADASSARSTLGAQAALGYTPVNAAAPDVSGSLISTGWFISGGAFNNTRSLILQQSAAAGAVRAEMQALERVGFYYTWLFRLSAGGAWVDMEFRSDGSLTVPGSINGASKNFLIDHPLDPFNRDLIFSSTESPHYGVEAWGVARLEGGRATVDIDAASNLTTGTWAALTQNTIVTSLQNQDGFARLRPGPVAGGQFEIIAEDDECGDLVAWRVVADRNDPVVKTLGNADPETGLLIPEADKEDLA
ncbi:hypothetical protein [Martelella soudanensis]|uniref:hypothetical protein n=1 Tax=unclassified Martelella TaxID=2629616 RepID=UPI0015DD6C07|nr:MULTISPECIES: hypothetical protein [unclassified Martelella]